MGTAIDFSLINFCRIFSLQTTLMNTSYSFAKKKFSIYAKNIFWCIFPRWIIFKWLYLLNNLKKLNLVTSVTAISKLLENPCFLVTECFFWQKTPHKRRFLTYFLRWPNFEDSGSCLSYSGNRHFAVVFWKLFCEKFKTKTKKRWLLNNSIEKYQFGLEIGMSFWK